MSLSHLQKNVNGLIKYFDNIEVEAKTFIDSKQYSILMVLLSDYYNYKDEEYSVLSEKGGNKRIIKMGNITKSEYKDKYFVYKKGDKIILNDKKEELELFKIKGFRFTVSNERIGDFKYINNPLIRNIKRRNFYTNNFIVSLSEIGNKYELEIELGYSKYKLTDLDKIINKEIYEYEYKELMNMDGEFFEIYTNLIKSNTTMTKNYIAKRNENKVQITRKRIQGTQFITNIEELKNSKYELQDIYVNIKNKDIVATENFIAKRKENDVIITIRKMDFSFLENFIFLLFSLINSNQPRDIHFDNITYDNMILNPYRVTLKADGARGKLIIGKMGAILFSKNIKKWEGKFETKLFDVEILSNQIFVFDILYDNMPLTELSFIERYKILKKIKFPELNGYEIKLKPHYSLKSNNFFKTISNLLNEKSIPIDGLIFTPEKEIYMSQNIFKWKPVEDLTIDLKITSDGLYASKKNILVPIKNVQVEKNNINYSINDIVEFKIIYDGSYLLIPYRNRTQDGTKSNPNSIKVVDNIFSLHRDPILQDDITGNSLRLMRKYHNRVKRDIYKNLYENNIKNILDIGSGKGGDISSWKQYGFNVIGIEPNQQHFQELINRLQIQNFNATIINDKLENINLKSNIITFFNSITFFFKNETSKKNLITKLNKFKYILIFGFDANKFKSFYPQGVDTDIMTVQFLNNNKVFVNLKSQTVDNQTEYIVDFNYIINNLNNYDIIDDFYLNEEKLMSSLTFNYTSSTRYILFRKK
jgi:translation initiation factor 1 (eIF-1/SUI1)